jgi:hypothetical protein
MNVTLAIFNANIIRNPTSNTTLFFQEAPLSMYAANTAKTAKPNSEYMPEQATATANSKGKPEALCKTRTGESFGTVSSTGRPKNLRKLKESWEPTFDNKVPAEKAMSRGGMASIKSNAIGKAKALSIAVENSIMMQPETKIGREAR